MEDTKTELVRLCQEHPEGLSVSQLQSLYLKTYGKPLVLGGSSGQSSLKEHLRIMSDQLCVSSTGRMVWPLNSLRSPAVNISSSSFSPPRPSSSSSEDCTPALRKDHSAQKSSKALPLQKLKRELLSLLGDSHDGVEVAKLRDQYKQRYGRPLTLAKYGLGGLDELLTTLGDRVCVERRDKKNMVRLKNPTGLKDHSQSQQSDVARRSTGEQEQEREDLGNRHSSEDVCRTTALPVLPPRSPVMEKDLLDLLALVRENPKGIRLKGLSVAFGQHYHRNLTVASLGFDSMATLVASLEGELLLEGGLVFHRAHRPRAPAVRPPGASLPVGKDPPLAPPCVVERPGRDSSSTPPSSEHGLRGPAPPLLPSLSRYGPPTSAWALTARGAAAPTPSASPSLHDGVISSLQFGTQPPVTPPPVTPPHTPAPPPRPLLPPAQPAPQATPEPALVTSDSDFPELRREGRPTRAQERRPKTLAQSRGKAQGFTEAYHAQLRQVHGANVRAMEALSEEEGDGRQKGRWRKTRLDPDAVNSLVMDVIRDIAAEGELVTQELVTGRVCRLMQVPSLEAGGITRWHLPALKELQRNIREINMFIQSLEAVSSVYTLYEVGVALAGLKNKKRYEELNLGPLCKLPLIHQMFKVDGSTKDEDIVQVQTVDILRSLREFRRTQRPQPVDLAAFLKHMADQYDTDCPYKLGIKIHSIGLPIATLNKVQNCEHDLMEQARQTVYSELQQEMMERMRKVKRSVMEMADALYSISSLGSSELRRKYVSMTAAEAVREVFENAAAVFHPQLTKLIKKFLSDLTREPLALSIFQLVICGTSLAPPQDVPAKADSAPRPTKNGIRSEETNSMAPLPSEASVRQVLLESLSNHTSTLTLSHVASLERKLTKHFQVTEFTCLEQGTFLEFLVKQAQVLQETVGGSVSLGGSSVEAQGCGFRPSRQDVFEFIRQCGAVSATNDPDGLSHTEGALRAHYGVRDSRDLGLGPLRTLVGLVQRQRELAQAGQLSQVCYEAALFSKEPSSTSVGEAVGRLGEVSLEQALASLLCCPLLEDLGQWSQWELVFSPLHGPLRHFIDKNAARTDLAALELSPGVLLRVTTSTGDKFFSQAAMTLDPVGTAGHLVSMVVADGVANAPTALLANHMESSLAAAVVREEASCSEEDDACFSTVGRFLLDCLIRIPARTCRALLQQVFLEPFSRVLGQAKSKAVLLGLARADLRHLNCLHQLGVALGITEWARDYQRKLTPAPPPPSRHAAPEHCQTTPVDSLNTDLSALNVGEEDEDHPDVPAALEDYNTDSSPSRKSQADAGEEDLYDLGSLANRDASRSSETQRDGEGSVVEEEQPLPQTEGMETVSSQEERTENLPKAIIDDIRKSEFGVGVELNPEGQRLMMVHQERLGRSLDRLSTELYSKDTHFVLELIQNADDNSYRSEEAGGVPALAFLVGRDCITVLNNETGFQERNVRAICDVGRSTKGKHTYGYIGQKGIGFKSVFKVSDCPEIHSNGFHLRFDKTSGPMGYILPHWAEDRALPDTRLGETMPLCSSTTKIVLPLRSESHQTRNLFHDVHPSLMLFLHRLRSISIYNLSEKRVVTMTRRDLSDSVLEVEHTEGTERWLVVKRTLHPIKIKEGVETTELALAFQLGNDATGSDISAPPQKQPVFAFLPLRSFGFRFIIQGDFDIPSSREDVDRDSSWNQWLRSEVPQLFLHAMDVFISQREFRGLRGGLCHFLQFVPLPDEVLDFFKPVAGQIIQLLKGKAFLPTLNKDGIVEDKLPSQVAVCQDAVIRDVIGAEELDRHLSLAYLHPALQPAPPLSLLTHLGVRQLRGSDVTAVTMAMAKELLQGEGINSAAGQRGLARLLVCNFRALQQGYGEPDAILHALRELPIIPLADGRVVALSRERVFFPMERSETSSKTPNTSPGVFGALYQDVPVVRPALLGCLEPLEAPQVRELLKRLGVHELEPQQLLQQHIYPALRNQAWRSKPEAVLVSYLVFIKQHSSCTEDYTHPDTTVPVLTTRGLRCPQQDRVHFSKEYGNVDLPTKLPGCDWVLLSGCYVQTDGDVSGWRELFTRLGVRDRLIIRKERRTLTTRELASGPWAVESELWPCGAKGPEGVCVLDDYPSEEFTSLVTAQLPAPAMLEQRRALLELLHAHWDTGDRYSQYLTAQVVSSEGRRITSTKSSFLHFLSRLPWVPANRLQPGGGQEVEYLCPNSIYLFSPEVHGLLGTHVRYLDMRPSELTQTLGMRHKVTVEELIGYLKKWCVKTKPAIGSEGHEPEEELEGSEFTSTVQHIHNVYSYLHKNCSQSSLKELFQHTPAIFIEYHRKEEWCSGRFYHLKEVCWSDPTAMFQRYRQLTRGPGSTVQEPRVLAPFYRPLEGMQDLFTRLLSVEPSPSMRQYVWLLEVVCSSTSLATGDVLKDVSVLYAKLADKCKTPGDQEHSLQINPSYCSTLKGMLLEKRVFPTKDSAWVSLASRPMLSDSKELEKIFKNYKDVCLLNLPPADKKTAPYAKTGPLHGRAAAGERACSFSEDDRALFLDICGVPRLSQRVSTEAQTENYRPCPAMQALVRSLVPYIQRFLCHHDDLAPLYRELLDDNVAQRLRQLSYGQVGKLYTRYLLTLADDEAPIVEMEDVVCLLKDRKELYIQKDHLTARLDICRELAKLFCTESSHRKELVHFLGGLMTSIHDPAALKRFLHKEDIRDLPQGEEPWEVPEPVEVKPEPVIPVINGGLQAVGAPEEELRPRQENGEQTLTSWPPRSSLCNVPPSSGPQPGRQEAVKAVLRMWPPPAGPVDPRERDPAPAGRSSHEGVALPHDGAPSQQTPDRPADHHPPSDPGPTLDQPLNDHSNASADTPRPADVRQEGGVAAEWTRSSPGRGESGEEARPSQRPPGSERTRRDADQPGLQDHAPSRSSSSSVPETVVFSVFQGTGGMEDAGLRPPLTLDPAVWTRPQPPQAPLEDLELCCQRPTTIVLSDDPGDSDKIGDWGEALVNSFLCHWRDSGALGSPSHITWYNQQGQSGYPCDFKLTFDPREEDSGGEGGVTEVYVEVKATVRRERAFVHLSANELDMALRLKERYHVFRVYNAGDAQNVRLCRIQNLAQHLHTKDLQLFLFV